MARLSLVSTMGPNDRFWPICDMQRWRADFRFWLILLQKSTVAWPRIFRENTKQKAITDSYDLNRIAEVACEFNVRR
jgi:hypothetical protein